MSEKRPRIQVGNEPPRPMTDAEYADYLAEMERLAAEMPKPEPTPEERLAALEEALLERDVMIAEMALQLQNR